MLKKICLIITTLFVCVYAYSKTISLDARGACFHPTHPEEQSQFFVSFHATPASMKNNSPGHAYIVLSAPHNAFEKVCLPEAGYGQNPKEKSISTLFSFEFNMDDGIKFKITEGGVIEEDLSKLEPFHELKARITYEQFNDIYLLTQKWKSEDYILTKKDCIDFIIDVAKSIDFITVPNRQRTKELPTDYLKSLIDENKEI